MKTSISTELQPSASRILSAYSKQRYDELIKCSLAEVSIMSLMHLENTLDDLTDFKELLELGEALAMEPIIGEMWKSAMRQTMLRETSPNTPDEKFLSSLTHAFLAKRQAQLLATLDLETQKIALEFKKIFIDCNWNTELRQKTFAFCTV